ncbi:hypothetical protein C0J52_21513 [Blattella germanica]|nr:hypothetical protein C0J52_21513 [Blattella germanica]
MTRAGCLSGWSNSGKRRGGIEKHRVQCPEGIHNAWANDICKAELQTVSHIARLCPKFCKIAVFIWFLITPSEDLDIIPFPETLNDEILESDDLVTLSIKDGKGYVNVPTNKSSPLVFVCINE